MRLVDHCVINIKSIIIKCLELLENMEHIHFRDYDNELRICKHSLFLLYDKIESPNVINHNLLFHYHDKNTPDIVISNIHLVKFEYIIHGTGYQLTQT